MSPFTTFRVTYIFDFGHSFSSCVSLNFLAFFLLWQLECLLGQGLFRARRSTGIIFHVKEDQ
jgi:hypothetical protein